MDKAENQINYMEHKEAKNNQLEQQEEKRIQKNEGSISSLWNNFKRSHICIIGVPVLGAILPSFRDYSLINRQKSPTARAEWKGLGP